MAKIKDGGPAFPDGTTNEWGYAESKGLSKRDYFAAKAMHAKMLCDAPAIFPRGMTVAEYVAQQAYAMADAMLKAREPEVK